MNFRQVLSDGQVQQIRGAAENLLETVGFKVMDAEALRQCAAAGARVDETSAVVWFPRSLLHELLGQVPSTYTISGINGNTHEIGGEEPWGVAIVTDPWIVDYQTQEPRRPCLDDVRRHTILAQRMAPVAAISRMDFPVSDVDGPTSSLRAWEQHLLLHDKHHYFAPAEAEGNRRWKDIVAILAQGGDPTTLRLFSIMVAVISPLTVSALNIDLLRLAREYDAPVVPTVCPMAGSTAPYSLASTLVVGHAENLAMAALTQILKPGQPFLYCLGPSVMDLAAAQDLYYTLDKVLWKVAAVQLGKSYNLPTTAECGGTMTYRYDQQNGMEGFLFMLAAVASGADVLSGFGSCYTGMGMSAEMMLIQQAWLDATRFLQRGMPTDSVRLGMDNIKRAGPGGDFLTDGLTLQFKEGGEFFAHPLFDLAPCAPDGYPVDHSRSRSRSMLERAHEEAEALVAGFASPVPHDIQEALVRYFHDECVKLEA